MSIEHSFVQKFLDSDFAQLLVIFVILVTPVIVTWGFRLILRHWRMFVANLKWISMELKTMDYALQKSFKNGYKDYKKEAKDKILATMKDKKILEDSDFGIEL